MEHAESSTATGEPYPGRPIESLSCLMELDKVQIQFAGAVEPVLRNVSMNLRSGEFLAIVGPSGCGKSTLLRLMAGLLSPTLGCMKTNAVPALHGEDPDRNTGVKFGFVFQQPTLLPWRTARDNVLISLELGRDPGGISAGEYSRVDELLTQVGLNPADGTKRPAEMSGGMQMRLSLARALMSRPDILLLDEPLAAVDDLLRMKLQQDICRLHDTLGLTTVLVTHNLHEAVFMSDRVLVLGGRPATVVAEQIVPLPRPRDGQQRGSNEAHRLVNELTDLLLSNMN